MTRIEDPPLITGGGQYVGDLIDRATLHCWFVRSPVAHGAIRFLDVEDARQSPGVVAVLTAADLELDDIPGSTGRGPAAEAMTRPVLARDRVRYVGDPVAVVVAQTARQAEDAAGLVWVDIDEFPAVTSIDQALGGETTLFAGADGNLAARLELHEGPLPPDPPAVSATVVVESGRLAPVTIEPLGILARPGADGIHVFCTHQAPHRLANQLAKLTGIPRARLRVTVPDVGGAFGMKGMLFPEYVVVTFVAERLGRPVAWIQTRREQFVSGTHGRGMRHTVTLEGDVEGVISRMAVKLEADLGAYPHNGSQVPLFTRFVAVGPYRIPRLEFTTTMVVTNLAPTGSYRGAGRPEAALALERAIDAFARAARMDPVEVRRRNLIPPQALPHVSPTGAVYDSGDYPAALQMAADLIGLEAVRDRQHSQPEGAGELVGVGFGAFIERAGGALESGEYGRVEVRADPPGIIVRTGSTDSGQGHQTVWSDVVEAVFETGNVEVVAGDTAHVADGIGTFASRSAQLGASAAQRLAVRVLDAARRRAAARLEAAEHDLVYSAGTFSVAGSPGSDVTIWALAETEALAEEETFAPGAQTFPYGVHAAVVRVSTETGEVTIEKLVAVDDCGRVLNEMIVEGQIHGSLVQGIGQALYEEIRYDPEGQPVTASLMDYLIPTAGDVAPPTSARLEHPAPSNPLGVKGTGEAGCIGGPPAVVNAVLDALLPLGVTDLQLPLRPRQVWAAIQAAVHGG